MYTTASFHWWEWWPALRHADIRFSSRSGSAFHAYLRSIQVCPDWPGANWLATLLRRVSIRFFSIGGIVCVGLGGGSSAKYLSIFSSICGKKHCDNMLAISSWVWAIPSVPCSNDTLDVFLPCLQAVTSQSSDFSIYSSAYLHFATLTVPLSLAWAMLLVSGVWALHRFWAAMVQAVFYQGEALEWEGHCLWKIFLLVLYISAMKATASSSTLASVGMCWKEEVCDLLLNVLTHSSHFSRLTMKPRSVSLLGLVGSSLVCPDMCSIAWSEPILPSQSMVRSENVEASSAASLYHARSITESLSWPAPFLMTSLVILGLLESQDIILLHIIFSHFYVIYLICYRPLFPKQPNIGTVFWPTIYNSSSQSITCILY